MAARGLTSAALSSGRSSTRYRLAYISEELVNWCPGLGTVLANEEITADGRSAVGNYPVFRRPLRQWMLRITAFAERLTDDLDLVDWPESIKLMQRNWIGASDGAYVNLPVAGQPGLSIEVFTTRPDTLYGATFVVMAPEHPLADEFIPGTSRDCRDGVPGDDRAAQRSPAHRCGPRKDGRVHRRLRRQPGHRGADPGLPGRLRAARVRYRRDHGRPRP